MLPAMPKLLYFAQLVDVLDVSSEDLQLEAKPILVVEFSAKLAQRGGAEASLAICAVRGSRSRNLSLSSKPSFDRAMKLHSSQAAGFNDA